MLTGQYDSSRSRIDKSGGFYITHKEHDRIKNPDVDKSDIAADILARKGYKVYLDSEKSYIEYDKKPDGRIYRSVMDIKTINSTGSRTIQNGLQDAEEQTATIAILMQNTPKMTRVYVEDQIKGYWNKGGKIKEIIVVGMSGRIHRHKK